jgi:protease I
MQEALDFVKAFDSAGKPIAAICHAAWLLAEAKIVDGRKLTSYHSIQTDLKNAGANWVDESCVVDGNLTTSRNPSDLPHFCQTMVEQFSGAGVKG